jgi:hypothetical protein
MRWPGPDGATMLTRRTLEDAQLRSKRLHEAVEVLVDEIDGGIMQAERDSSASAVRGATRCVVQSICRSVLAADLDTCASCSVIKLGVVAAAFTFSDTARWSSKTAELCLVVAGGALVLATALNFGAWLRHQDARSRMIVIRDKLKDERRRYFETEVEPQLDAAERGCAHSRRSHT